MTTSKKREIREIIAEYGDNGRVGSLKDIGTFTISGDRVFLASELEMESTIPLSVQRRLSGGSFPEMPEVCDAWVLDTAGLCREEGDDEK